MFPAFFWTALLLKAFNTGCTETSLSTNLRYVAYQKSEEHTISYSVTESRTNSLSISFILSVIESNR